MARVVWLLVSDGGHLEGLPPGGGIRRGKKKAAAARTDGSAIGG